MKTEPKPNTAKRVVRHDFSPDEIANLNVEFGQAYSNLLAVEADIAAEKSRLKAKAEQAQASMSLKHATLAAGYEMREKECWVVLRPVDSKKDFFIILSRENGKIETEEKPILTEPMTQEDFEQDLLAAEALFEQKTEIPLWDVDEGGRCKVVVGAIGNRWYTAVRGYVGAKKIEERLDSEQRATKKRFDAIKLAMGRLSDWLKVTLGKEDAAGFADRIQQVLEDEEHKVE